MRLRGKMLRLAWCVAAATSTAASAQAAEIGLVGKYGIFELHRDKDGCQLTTGYDDGEFVSIRFDALRRAAFLSFTNGDATSVKPNEKQMLDIYFLKDSKDVEAGWNETDFVVRRGDEGRRRLLVSQMLAPQFLSDIAGSQLIAVYDGDEKIAAYSVANSDGAVAALRQCAFEQAHLNPREAAADLVSMELLEDTITEYWLDEPDAQHVGHLSAQLRKIADPKRDAESRMVRNYGYFNSGGPLRREKGWKVVRLEHEHAVVDWYVQDDGREITALTWKKVADK